MAFNEFEEYKKQGEPSQKQKAENWAIAIGLQKVDNLIPENLSILSKSWASAEFKKFGMLKYPHFHFLILVLNTDVRAFDHLHRLQQPSCQRNNVQQFLLNKLQLLFVLEAHLFYYIL